ncbi:efflux RND transporter periplasmic adaptor subunit [Catenovulum adriaticum]|uniref:Efflux RND transporter periplasmic adaptor subunit n=1 Tax=Catenovulum adriaticum TaxID=2984846 RepID=A0ABY7AIW8_9ALTE|nr:efflux RND transporter periplasmic adaptor subunit [Catenovulum sp. TS8]WAJ69270.1 efflux RND transporter periplasmic adaptor subunit [Catenovulum sp. TS8]
MLKIIKKFMPLVLIVLFIGLVWVVVYSKPQANRKFTPPEAQISVDVKPLKAVDYPIIIDSYGLVEAQIQTALTSQVGGKITYVSESMRGGGFFDKDELLIEIEAVDYQADVDIAYANLVDAQQAVAEQKALADQALKDWQRLGNSEQAPDLVLRKPQLSAAKAKLASAAANYEQAKIQLERTKITAPYAGRVLNKSVDLGQVVSGNTQLGEIYSTEAIEISLPIKNNEISLVALPEDYRGATRDVQVNVDIISQLAGNEVWQGKLVRTASEISEQSRQLHVVARIQDPFGEKAYGKMPLKIGQYVTAKIQGKTLNNVIILENKTIYQGSYVYTYENGVLQRKNIEILWQNNQVAVIKSGLKDGDVLVTTPLGQVSTGTRVKLKQDNMSKPANTARTDKRGQANKDKQGEAK